MNHTYSVEDTEKRFKTDIKNGLSSSEAKKRLSSAGKNILKEKKNKNLIVVYCSDNATWCNADVGNGCTEL